MNILLINPSLQNSTTGQYEKEVEKLRGLYPSLGLGYVAAVLEKKGHKVKIIDYDVEEELNLEKICVDFEPQVVGFYAMTWTYRHAKELAEQIKKIDSQIITLIGGPNVSCLPKDSIECGLFDYGVYGEGEETVVELIKKLNGKIDVNWGDIRGIIYKKDNQVIINPPRQLIEDLDSIPFPARHLLPIEKYFDIFTQQKHFATIIATRGCPFNCIFCDRKNRMGRNWRVRSPQNIAAEIKEVKEKFGIKEFMFFDDNLIVDKKWGLELCRELKPLKIIWECRNRVDLVDEEILRAMKEAGCYRIRFGFESGDDHILKVLKKDITVAKSLKAAKLSKKIGIEMFGYFMLGSPGETQESMDKTIDLALKINPSFAAFSKTILIPGSELFDFGLAHNLIDIDYWRRFLRGQEKNGAPSISTPELPEEVVDVYVKKAEKKFYFRLKYIISKILALRSFNQLINQARIAWALFK
ncbi:B12-binding domain-containing radical SAM protein [Patescibacteria group bacterium]|nr:B12-binding domain-containing radical SAM protein [Patescibacteria group bacterium]